VAHQTLHLRSVLLGFCALASSACSDDGDTSPAPGSSPSDNCPVVVPDAECDKSLRPFVFVHGTFGSATEVSNIAHLMGSNGYCQERFVAVEYNSLGGAPDAQLAALVDQVLADTGFDQVDLAGHSQGTGHACNYLSDPARRAKVAHYVNFSGACAGQGVPTLSVSSEGDGVGNLPRGPIHPGADNVTPVTLINEDHVAVAGSKEAFIAVYNYLFDKEPQYTTIQCGQNPVILDGKVVTFGDNEPRAGATMDLFELDKLTAPWERGAPDKTITADATGHFRAELKRNVLYEIRVTGSDGELLGYGYPGPFVRSNYLTRFLTPSLNPLIADSSTNRVVRGPNHVGLVSRYVAGALRKDWGNSLKIDGQEVLTAENAPRREMGGQSSVIGSFMYDANENGQSDLGAVFGPASFLVGTDVFMDAKTPRWMRIEWTNEENRSIVMKVPNWPSERNLASLNLPYP
jgi:pimeloyl-ACP methyl ester carboxylesterase